jgi:hypothetical protein
MTHKGLGIEGLEVWNMLPSADENNGSFRGRMALSASLPLAWPSILVTITAPTGALCLNAYAC